MEYHEGHDVTSSTRGNSRLLSSQDHSSHGYVMINSGESSDPDPVTGKITSEMFVFETSERGPPTVKSRIEGGGRMVHSYGVHTRNEFWSHSDIDGKFYIVHLSDLDKHIGTTVTKFEESPSHGKLLWNENGDLGDRGFATGTGETFLWEVDLETKNSKKYDFSNDVSPGTCFGLHAIAYSSKAQHVFAECVGGGGALEFDVSNGDIKFIHQWVNHTGSLYEVLDGSYVIAANKGGDAAHVWKATSTGSAHDLVSNVELPGNPSTVTFYPLNNGGEADYIACMPQTEVCTCTVVDWLILILFTFKYSAVLKSNQLCHI